MYCCVLQYTNLSGFSPIDNYMVAQNSGLQGFYELEVFTFTVWEGAPRFLTDHCFTEIYLDSFFNFLVTVSDK